MGDLTRVMEDHTRQQLLELAVEDLKTSLQVLKQENIKQRELLAQTTSERDQMYAVGQQLGQSCVEMQKELMMLRECNHKLKQQHAVCDKAMKLREQELRQQISIATSCHSIQFTELRSEVRCTECTFLNS